MGSLNGRIRRLEESRPPERTSRPDVRGKMASSLEHIAAHKRAGGEPCPYEREDYADAREYLKDVVSWYEREAG